MPLGEAVTHREAGKAVGYYNTCVIQQRVERAKRLLRQPDSSIAAIAKGNWLGVDGYLRLLEKRDRIIQLPLGIQLHGRRWQDERILAIAQAMSAVVAPLPTVPSALMAGESC